MRGAFRAVFRSGDFVKLWVGQVVSMLGDRLGEMGVVALYVAHGATSVTALLATLSALVIAPQVVMSLGAGYLIDRIDRRRILLASDAVRAVLVLALPWAYVRYGDDGVYGVTLLLGTATAFFTPAKSSVLPLLVPAEALPAGNGLSATTNVLATLIGSYVGGHLAAGLGVNHGRSPTPFFVIDALSYGFSAFLIWRIVRGLKPAPLAVSVPGPGAAPALRLSLWARSAGLWSLLVTAVLFWIVAAITYSAMNSYAYVRFGRGVIGIGDMQASLGLGMLVGALVAGRDPMPFFAARVWPLLLATAAGLLLLNSSGSWNLALAAVVLIGAAAAWVLVAVDTHLQRRVPDGLRGRAFGLKQQLTALAFMGPSLGFRWVAHLDRTLPVLVRWAAWGLCGAACAFLVLSFLERLDRARRADWGSRWLNRLDGLNRLICRRFHGLVVDDVALPPDGPALLAANHVSGLDPMLLIAAVDRPLRFLIAEDEYERWWLRWLFQAMGCIPVAPGQSRRALASAQAALAAGEVVALFPQGGIFRPGTRERLKRGVAVLAAATGAPVLAVHVSGVRGVGRKIAAVFLPSRARLQGSAPLHYGGPAEEATQCFLDRLAERLAGGLLKPP